MPPPTGAPYLGAALAPAPAGAEQSAAARLARPIGQCILKTAPTKIAGLTQIASGIPAEDVLNAFPEDIFEFGNHVYEINNMKDLGDRIKRALSLGRPPVQVKAQ